MGRGTDTHTDTRTSPRDPRLFLIPLLYRNTCWSVSFPISREKDYSYISQLTSLLNWLTPVYEFSTPFPIHFNPTDLFTRHGWVPRLSTHVLFVLGLRQLTHNLSFIFVYSTPPFSGFFFVVRILLPDMVIGKVWWLRILWWSVTFFFLQVQIKTWKVTSDD